MCNLSPEFWNITDKLTEKEKQPTLQVCGHQCQRQDSRPNHASAPHSLQHQAGHCHLVLVQAGVAHGFGVRCNAPAQGDHGREGCDGCEG